jgi:hypothetical protein
MRERPIMHKSILHFPYFAVALFFCVIFANQAYAACSGPVANAGGIIYNSTHSVLQFCDGTNWINAGGSGGGGGSADDLGNHTATQDLAMGGFDIAGAVDITYSGILTDTSDRRLKENITPLESALMLEQIKKIEGVSFSMKNMPGKTEYGVIAQDIEKIFPHLVVTADDEAGTKSVNYMGLISPMIEAIKAQQKQIDLLKEEIEALKNSKER